MQHDLSFLAQLMSVAEIVKLFGETLRALATVYGSKEHKVSAVIFQREKEKEK